MTGGPTLPQPLASSPEISQWLDFATDGTVALRSGRVELGQGNLTAFVQIAAEELDVAPGRISIIGADTRSTPNEGFTSGSMSMPVGGQCVRLAASAARELLLAEAAKLLQRGKEELSIVDGAILAGSVPTDLTLWKLAAEVSLDVDIARHAAPKPPAQRSIVGRSLPRIDLQEKITGAPFVHDLGLEGMLHGRPVHPPTMRARGVTLDMDRLRQRPGVMEAIRDGAFIGIIAEREVDAIAAARWAAGAARWDDEAEFSGDPVEQIAESCEPSEVVHSAGALDDAQGERVATTVSRPYISHASIGPSCAVARWTGGRLTLWSHTQGAFPLRDALAMVFDIAPERIDVIHMPGAGCYGHNGADDAALDAALMARAVPGRPVRVVWSRADEFTCAPLGPAMVTSAEATIDQTATITSMQVMANSAPHGNRPGRNGAPNLRAAAYLDAPFAVPRSSDIPAASGGGADRNATPLYDIAHQVISKRVVHELPFRTSSLRALGGYLNVFAIETLMDDLAASRGIDPVEFRLRHLSDPRARDVITATARAANWPGTEQEGVGTGLGFARYKNTAAWCAVIARVEVSEEVRVTHAWSRIDAGEAINPDGIINQTEGGIIQATSWTLKEALALDGAAVDTAGWEAYPILRFSEVPEMDVQVIDRPEEPMLGCAEAAQGPTAAAIGNAVFRALGVRARDLPLTRDRLVAALT